MKKLAVTQTPVEIHLLTLMGKTLKPIRGAGRSTHPQGDQKETENLAMTWIDYKKTHDIVPQSWIIDNLIIYKISSEVIKFIENTMEN